MQIVLRAVKILLVTRHCLNALYELINTLNCIHWTWWFGFHCFSWLFFSIYVNVLCKNGAFMNTSNFFLTLTNTYVYKKTTGLQLVTHSVQLFKELLHMSATLKKTATIKSQWLLETGNYFRKRKWSSSRNGSEVSTME